MLYQTELHPGVVRNVNPQKSGAPESNRVSYPSKGNGLPSPSHQIAAFAAMFIILSSINQSVNLLPPRTLLCAPNAIVQCVGVAGMDDLIVIKNLAKTLKIIAFVKPAEVHYRFLPMHPTPSMFRWPSHTLTLLLWNLIPLTAFRVHLLNQHSPFAFSSTLYPFVCHVNGIRKPGT